VRVSEGHIVVTVEGKPVLEAFDTAFSQGRIGLLAEQCESVIFDDVRVRFNPLAAPLLPAEQAFAHEQSMLTWAGAGSDWGRLTHEKGDGMRHPFSYHRAHFYGDVTMAVLVPKLRGEHQGISLAVGADPAAHEIGYWFDVERQKGQWIATLSNGLKTIHRQTLANGAKLHRVNLRRAGSFIVAGINGKEVARHRDVASSGMCVGYNVMGGTPAWDDIRVFTNNVYNDLFRQAPADWRVTGGVWEVTNRWECDDRWSFFSGRSKALAAIWNKQRFAGDLVVEFYAGIKMNSDRGDAYQYAGDINLTICGDGQDLTSGYSFLFGGWDDTTTAIVRQEEIVARTSKMVIPREKGIHRRWFYVRVTKRGGELNFSIDGSFILTYTDPNPLSDGQIALWTHNNGLMVARVRVSHEGAMPAAVVAGTARRNAKCIYDVLPSLPEL